MTSKLITLLFVLTSALLNGQNYQDQLANFQEKADYYFYTNKDSTYYFHEIIYELALKHKDYVTAIDKLNEVCFAAGYYFDIQKIKTTIDRLDILLLEKSNELNTLNDKGFTQKNYLLYNKGNYFHKIEDFDQAEIYFNSIINNIISKDDYKKNPDDVAFLSTCYSFIAQINTLQNRFDIATTYYKKNIRLYKKYLPNDISGLHKIYNLFASSLYAEKKYEQAKKYWLETLSFSEKNYDESNRNSIVTTSLLLSNLYSDAEQIDSSRFYLKKIEKYKVKNDPFEDRYLYSEGSIYLKEKKYFEALKAYKSAFDVSRKSDQPRLQKKIADLHLEQGQFKQALKNYQLGLQELSPNFSSSDVSQNPAPTTIIQKHLFLKFLSAKAKTLNILKSENYETQILKAVDTSLKTLDLLKPNYRNQADKLNLIEDSFSLFESGIEACYQLYLKKKEERFLDKIFYYSEKSKSVLLLDALLNTKATRFAKIPKELLQKESYLKSTITYYKKQIELGVTTSSLLEDEIFKLNNEHTDLIKTFETKYPSYYNLRYNTTVVSIASVQNSLTAEEMVISYFYGKESIYALAITANSKKILKIPNTASLEKNIVAVYDMLSSNTSSIHDLNAASYSLYKVIIAPLLKNSKNNKLLIVPDGLLNYISFDALNSQEKAPKYLLEQYAISSINSLTLLNQLYTKNNAKNSVLAFAPQFNGEPVQGYELRTGLSPLPNNKNEIHTVLNSFKGSSFSGNQASLFNFNAEVSSHNIIHLATHAFFDDSSPEYSYLAFTPEEKKDYVLYASDIYNLDLSADLVTLSACETGIGELKKGEGALSLSRAFFYSGSKSIVHTLWNVVDQSASDIMNNFYKNLAKGKRKDVAIQEAKLSYLNKNKETALSHPYYWSSFIIQGNTDALTTTPNYWVWVIITLIIVLLLYFNRKRLLQIFQ